MTNGAGHSYTASQGLSCPGVHVDDFIVEVHTAEVIREVLGRPDGIPGLTSIVELADRNLGLVRPDVDRAAELSAAFKKGLASKSGPKKS
jgi:hypothetical protein